MFRSFVRSRLVSLLALAVPMVIARATQSAITFADALQTGHLGPGALAATATGGLNVICISILAAGTVFIVQSFVAQLVGAGKLDETPKFAVYGIVIAAIAGVLTLGLIPAIGPTLSLTSYSPAVQSQMTDYMSIRLLSITAAVGIEALGNWYGGLGNTWMQTVAGVIQLVTAVFCNWLLIDGHWGAPALGVAGAAWAAVIATWLGFAFLAIAFWRRWGGAPRAEKLQLSFAEFRRVVWFGFPNGVNWFFDFAAFQVFVNFVLSSLGDETVAALNAVVAVNSVGFMPAFGIASAGAILAGQAIGANKRDEVWPLVKLTLACALTWMGALGLFYLVLPERILSLFTSDRASPAFVSVGATMLLLSAMWQVFDGISMTFAETLRAAGDTFWTAAARSLLAWAVFMPSAYLVVLRWHGGPVGAMLCLTGYLVLLAFALGLRFRTGAWKRIQLIETKPM